MEERRIRGAEPPDKDRDHGDHPRHERPSVATCSLPQPVAAAQATKLTTRRGKNHSKPVVTTKPTEPKNQQYSAKYIGHLGS